MRKPVGWAVLAAAGALAWGALASGQGVSVSTPTAAPAAALLPPSVPAHARRQLDTVAELSRDLQETVTFLEQGQGYFRSFQKGSHSSVENAEFLRFLKAYEREQDTAKQEVDALRRWVQGRSAVDAPSVP